MARASENDDSKKLDRARSSMVFAPEDLEPGWGSMSAAARLPCVLAGFAADLGLGLRPCERGEALGDTGGLNEVVGHVDEELEGQAEAVFDEARGEEDGLSGAEGGVAMADGAVAEFDGVGGRDEVFAGVGNGEGNEVVGALAERGRERGGDGADEALDVGFGDAGFAPGGVMDAVGGVSTVTCVATFSACHSSICAVPAMDLYSRRERSRLMMQTAKRQGGRTVFGFPLEGFSLFQSLLLAFASAFLTFFAATCLAIFALLGWNVLGGHSVSYVDTYRYVGLPAAVLVLVVALPFFGVLWVKAKIQK